jgi:NADPH-dependent 2,4-dienoyl-CoA reductase/sulfur reductase-like enzyme/peroxiredoxin family protein/rhodanese-related sulfurtransferase/TusA-related sulfurtransferase
MAENQLKRNKKILIVGGVAGGASFAARMRRLDEHAQIVIFERGDYISFANCGLPYFIGDTIGNRDHLIIQTPERFKERFNVEVRVQSEVVAVNPENKTITVRAGEKSYEESYDYLVLSPGSAPVRPPIDGVDSERVATLRSIPDMDRIKARVERENVSRAAVIGGGFIGLEMAENLRHKGLDVSLVELTDQVFMPVDKEMANILHHHLLLNGVSLYLSDGVKAFEETGGAIDVLLDSGERIAVDIVVLAIGVRPDTRFLRESGLELDQRGAIVADASMRTNLDAVFAVGDAVAVTDFVSGRQVHVPLAGPANRQGRIAADVIAGRDSRYKHTQGTAICKIFDLTAGVTGINEKNARRYGVSFIKSYTHSASHASYYPGAFPLSIKILFDPDTAKLLGAQVIGKDGVDKRIDVFATAVRHGLTVYDLSELELAYAPPYGSAKDPVNIAGFVAQNILEKRMEPLYAEEIAQVDFERQILLDVRTEAEHEQGAIPDSVNIPIDSLRQNLHRLDANKEVLVYCQVGLRGYLGTSILTQNGFRAKNLSGGYKTWSNAQTQNYDTSYLKPVADAACSTPTEQPPESAQRTVDATGLQCPGPIMQLKQALDQMRDGEAVSIRATDQGFALDVPSWCSRTGNSLVSLGQDGGVYTAMVRKGASNETCTAPQPAGDHKTMVIFSNDFDKMMAAFIIANGAASMGATVTLFFTFWGLNLLRKPQGNGKVKKSVMEKLFAGMMPKGPGALSLSKMNMGGMGAKMIQHVMKQKNVYSLQFLMDQALKNGVRFVACTMSMDIMGIKREELIDGVEFGGVSHYLERADHSSYNLFI